MFSDETRDVLKTRGVNFGVDWLTMTTTSPAKGDVYWAIFLALSKGKHKPWRLMQFEGLSSVTDDISVGIDHKTNRAILVGRGPTADEIIYARPPAPSQVSRIDLQATLELEEQDTTLIRRIYLNAEGTVQKKSHVVNNDDGQTCYLGSRHSTKFLRIYDAGIKHGLAKAGKLIRFEAEIKKPLAMEVLVKLWSEKKPYKIRQIIAANLQEMLERQNIGALWTEEELDTKLLVSLRQRKRGEDSTFTWLATQVASSIEKMMSRGYTRDELMAVLFPPVTPDQEF